jgi:hypothetical protein
VLRRTFGPKRDEVTEEWRKLHNEELHDLYSSLSIIRIIKSRGMRWAGHVARIMREKRNAYRLLVGKAEGKRPLGRPRHRWMGNIRIILFYTLPECRRVLARSCTHQQPTRVRQHRTLNVK